jgi:hypothetical protein
MAAEWVQAWSDNEGVEYDCYDTKDDAAIADRHGSAAFEPRRRWQRRSEGDYYAYGPLSPRYGSSSSPATVPAKCPRPNPASGCVRDRPRR